MITAAAGLAVIGWEMHPYTQLFYITVRVIIQYIPCWYYQRERRVKWGRRQEDIAARQLGGRR
jgi:hypothetical protein